MRSGDWILREEEGVVRMVLAPKGSGSKAAMGQTGFSRGWGLGVGGTGMLLQWGDLWLSRLEIFAGHVASEC